MKNILKLIIITLVFSSCNKDFLEVTPKNNLSEGNYYQTEQHALAAVSSAYEMFTWYEYSVTYMSFIEGGSDDGIPENPLFKELTYLPDDERISSMYNILYMGIFRCNQVIEKVPSINMDIERRSRIIGEAKFLRALYNWHIVTLWGESPLINNSLSVEEQTTQSKSTIAKFWSQIEIDLLGESSNAGAIDLLPVSYDDANIGRATKGAAIALLGKSYIYQEKWQEAANTLSQIIEPELGGEGIGNYKLVEFEGQVFRDSAGFHDAYLSVFMENPFAGYNVNDSRPAIGGENNSESIFELQHNEYIAFADGGAWLGWGNTGSFRNLYFGASNWGAYQNLSPSESFVNEFENGDPRFKASVFSDGDILDYREGERLYNVPFNFTESGSHSRWIFKKTIYPIWYAGSVSPINFPMIRYADVLLFMAEAQIHLSNNVEAIQMINRLRQRVGAPATIPYVEDLIASNANINNLPEALMHERRVELGFEGHRYRDLIRWSSETIGWVNMIEYNPNFQVGKHEFFPLPQYEVDLSNGYLLQNSNWN